MKGLPASLVSVAHRLTKQIRRRSASPQAREPLQIPAVIPVTYAHACYVPSKTSPPPSYIATAIASDGGIRRVLLPDRHPNQLHDPCGILLCNCGRPSDPKTGAEATFYQWEELKEGAVPQCYGSEHFIASPTVVVDNLTLPIPGTSSAASGTTILFVRLPAEISQTRNLEGVDETALLKELMETMTQLDSTSGAEQQFTDQIYLHLLGVDPPKREPQIPSAPEPKDNVYHQIEPHEPYLPTIIVTTNTDTPHIQEAVRTLLDRAGVGTMFDVEAGGIPTETALIFAKEEGATLVSTIHTAELAGVINGGPTIVHTTFIQNMTLYRMAPMPHPIQGATFGAELAPEIYRALAQAMTTANPPEETPRNRDLSEEIWQAMKKLDRQKEQEKKQKKSKPVDSAPASESEEEIEEDTEDYITPTAILDPKCPEIFHTFWNLTGLGYDKRRKFVAPHFPLSALQAQEDLGIDDLVSSEFVVWARAYQDLASQHALGELKSTKLEVGTRNSLAALQAKGMREVINLTRLNAPILAQQKVAQLDHRTVSSFFHKLRTYCLESAVPWDGFFTFTITTRTVGDEIMNQVMTSLGACEQVERFAQKISCYIEHIIHQLVPDQEDFWVKVEDITHQHVAHLTSANPTTEFLRVNLRTHASQLGFLNPWLERLQGAPTNDTPERIKDINDEWYLILLHRVLATTPLWEKLNMVYISNPNYSSIKEVPEVTLIKDLETILKAQRQKQASTAAITKTPVAKQTKPTSVMMSKCDICTRFGLQCARANKHCRRQGHQNTRQGFLESKIKKGHIGDVKFIRYDDCRKCHTAQPQQNQKEKKEKTTKDQKETNVTILKRATPVNATGQRQPRRPNNQNRPYIPQEPQSQAPQQPNVPHHSKPLKPEWSATQQKMAETLTQNYQANGPRMRQHPRDPQMQRPRPNIHQPRNQWQPRPDSTRQFERRPNQFFRPPNPAFRPPNPNPRTQGQQQPPQA